MRTERNTKFSLTLIAIFLWLLLPVFLKAQAIIYNQTELVRNYISECYEESINYFPSIACSDSIKGTFNLLPLYLNTLYNTRYAKSINDGAAWGGRGLNTTLGFGFSGNIGRITYVVNPVIHYSQNKDFYTGGDLNSRPEYQYPYNTGIDLVSRYGDDPWFLISPGQSKLSVDLNRVEVDLSTQNMRWGPAIYNPILMSTNAEGFPHLRIGTSRPLRSKVGDFEVNIFWGLLRESEYFNNDPDDDWRYFSAMNFGYRPGEFLEGLEVGFQRIFHAQTEYLTDYFYDSFIVFSSVFNAGDEREINGTLTNDYYDQMASFSLSYEFPEKQFFIYMEWAKGDFSANLVDFLEQPEHNRGYTFGFTKGFYIGGQKKLLILYENSSLGVWQTGFVRSSGPLYQHDLNYHGYTNNGQVIGASIGPGGQSNIVTITFENNHYAIKLDYERSRYNDDYFYRNYTVQGGPSPQDIEHQIGLIYSHFFENIQVDIGAFYANRANYLFNSEVVLNNVHSFITIKYNL